MKQQRIVSGITATGNLTIGNYIGAIKNFINLQKDNDLIVFVANLHAITTKISKETLRKNTIEMAALYIACGLDYKKNILFVQSDVLEHTNLAHILLCKTSVGELTRMTQYKDKSQKQKADNNTNYIPTGILTYPTLMAADILLYDATQVVVGKDQKQHLELTRNIAQRVNNELGHELFLIPTPCIPEVGSKIMDLQNPLQKMSKSSQNPKSYILLLDDPSEIRKKIRSAVTDSENKVYFDPKNKPGVSNLMVIYSVLENVTLKEIEEEYINKDYGTFKNAVAEVIIKTLTPIQENYKTIINSKEIIDILETGANKARKIAAKKMNKVLNHTGLNYLRK